MSTSSQTASTALESPRNLLVVLPVLTAAQREKIQEVAQDHGFKASFFESPKEALPFLEEAEVILGQSEILPRHAPHLRWLCTPSAGVNHLLGPDVFASGDALLSNSSGAYGVTIAEHTIMVLLSLLRKRLAYDEIVARREWKRDLPTRSILGSRFLLAGTGDIGQEIALRLRAFSPASIIGLNRKGRCPSPSFDQVAVIENMESFLPQTDALILSLPGTRETYHLLGERQLSLLPDGAVIVNVGRGSCIDQEALVKELRSGRLTAALDVFEKEPLSPDDPLWDCPGRLLTPHISGTMTLPYTVQRIVALFLEAFMAYCEGRPLKGWWIGREGTKA